MKPCVKKKDAKHFFQGKTAAQIIGKVVGDNEEQQRRNKRAEEGLMSEEEVAKLSHGTPGGSDIKYSAADMDTVDDLVAINIPWSGASGPISSYKDGRSPPSERRYIRLPEGLASHTQKTLCTLVTMETLTWLKEEDQLVQSGFLHCSCAVVDIDAEPARLLPHSPKAQRHFFGDGLVSDNLEDESNRKSLAEPPDALNTAAVQEKRVSTFLVRSRDATDREDVDCVRRMAAFGSGQLLSITHGKARKRLADATKGLQRWLEERDGRDANEDGSKKHSRKSADEQRDEMKETHKQREKRAVRLKLAAIEQEQGRLVLDFVGLLDRTSTGDPQQQAAVSQKERRNKKKTQKTNETASDKSKKVTAPLESAAASSRQTQTTKGPPVEADPNSAYIILRDWLQDEQKTSMLRRVGSTVGPIMSIDNFLRTIDRVAAGDRSWRLPQPGEKPDASGKNYDAALMHLALLLNLFENGALLDGARTPKGEQPHAAWPEAIRMFGVTLLALAYPSRVFNFRNLRKPIAVASGLPISPSGDHEQIVLCCFRDQGYDVRNSQELRPTKDPDSTAGVDLVFASLVDPYSLRDLRVASLMDAQVQKRVVSTPAGGPSERMFWLSVHDHNSWDVEVNREAFLHYSVIDCADVVAEHCRTHRAIEFRPRQPLASLGARLGGLNEGPSVKTCFTSAFTKFECVNQELIAALLERAGGNDSMVLPFLPGAPQSATDYALENFFWERCAALADGDDADAEDGELPGVATAVLTMCAEEGLDVDTVIAEPAICCQKIRDALEDIGEKVTKSRKTVKHLRTLTKLGLLNLESELVRRNVRGSHITYHGPGGAATIWDGVKPATLG
eukprot:g4167.t1